MDQFEIGVVYSKNSRLYLAVTTEKLLSLYKGVQVVKPYGRGRYGTVRGITVDELCQRWGVSPEVMDNAVRTHGFLALDAEKSQTHMRPWGSGRTRKRDDGVIRYRIRPSV